VSSSNPSAQASSVSLSIPAEPGEAVWFDTSGSVPIARRLRGAHISLPLGAVPLDTDHGRALIASADGATVSVLDLASGEAIAKWVAPFEVAHGQLRAERIYVDGVLERARTPVSGPRPWPMMPWPNSLLLRQRLQRVLPAEVRCGRVDRA
jgi:hypothetical protein